MAKAIEAMNYTETGGAFGVRRTLGTFTLHTLPNGRIGVSDDYQDGKMVGFGYANAAAAVLAFQVKDDYRLVV